MNFYEQELRKLIGQGVDIDGARFVGRACYGRLTDNLRVKIEFATLGTMDKYEAIKAAVINKDDGPVDSALIRFADLFGSKPVSNPNFKGGIIPHIWEHNGKAEWYAYKPSPADFEQLAGALNRYLYMFLDQELGMEQDMPGQSMQRM